MEQHYDDTFLARWLNNELSKAEQATFQKSEYYKQYSKTKVDHTSMLQKQINENKKSNIKNASIVNKIVSEISQMKVYK